jgi:hypothetical protein
VPELPIEEFIYLVPELCKFEGLPEHLRSNRNLLQHCRFEAGKRREEIQNIVAKLTGSMELQNWGVKLDSKQYGFKTKVLPAPIM